MRLILTYLFLVLCSNASFAQMGAGIRGKIIDKSDNKPIAGAIVSIFKIKDSSNTGKTVSAEDGKFIFKNLISENYRIVIESSNYNVMVFDVLVKDSIVRLNEIYLEAKPKDLTTIVVQSKASAVIVKGDTTQYSAAQYKVNPDATIEDLIKKMPGVSVGRDGSVTAQGETVRKVTIDGKDFFGDDATAALKNLPADVVDKIQVFDRLSDQARLTGVDDGNSTKTINVVTKAGVKNGQLGRVFVGYGNDDRYSMGGNSSFFKNNRRLSVVGSLNNINQQNFAGQDLLGINGNNRNASQGGGGMGGGRPGGGGNDFTIGQVNGISKTSAFGINYSNEYSKKLTLSASYFYNSSKNENTSTQRTETFLRSDTNLFSNQKSEGLTQNNNHRINARFEYTFDSSNSLFYIPSFSFQNSETSNSSTFNNFYGEAFTQKGIDTLNINATNNKTNRNGFNIKNNLLYRHAFKKKGRSISVGLNHTLTKNIGETFSDGNLKYYNNGALTKDSIQNQFYDNATNGSVWGSTIAYVEPITKKAQLQFDYNATYQKNKADQKTFSFDAAKNARLDTLLTNNFDNTIITNNVGATYRFIPAKEELFQIGINVQTSQLNSDRIFPKNTKVNQQFANVLPNLIFRKKFSKKANIRIFYRTSVSFPTINQLQDVVNIANPIRVSSGNALLKQSYAHFLGSRYSFTNTKTNTSFFAGLFLQTTKNFITNASYIPRKDSIIQQGIELKKGSQFTKPENFNGYRNVRTFFNYSNPLKFIKSILSLNAGISYVRTPGFTNSTQIIINNFIYTGGFSVSSNISEYVDYTVSYAANFNQTNSTVSGKRNAVNQAMGVQANLLNKKGWFIQNDVSYQINTGLSAGLNQKFGLWNAAIGRKFLAKNAGELKLSVYDLLKQNQSIIRTADENRIQDTQNLVLQQYFMLTFTYSLKNFGTPAKKSNKREDR
jgi:hypothetical protein